MNVQQIFSTYDYLSNPLKRAAYCACCGTATVAKDEGGRVRSSCPRCGFLEYRNPAPAVSILISNGDDVLIGMRTPQSFRGGFWCMPCGFVEYDEDFLTAACREVEEESGLQVQLKSIINVTCNFLTPDLHSMVIVLRAEPTGGTLKAGDDLEFVRWFPLSGPLPEFAFAADKDIIERYAAIRIEGLPIETGFTFKNLRQRNML